MDCFVKKYQPGKYKAWINDEDVAPHPEDDEKRKVSRSQSLAGWVEVLSGYYRL